MLIGSLVDLCSSPNWWLGVAGVREMGDSQKSEERKKR